MLTTKYLTLAALLICDGLAQKRDHNAVYFENEVPLNLPQTRHISSMLSDIAQELIRRSSSSQILNLNLSNLVLLLVLKVVVYGAGYIGNHAFRGREDAPYENILSEGEIVLALGYMVGETCLYKSACQVPHTAKEYLGAAEIIFQTLQLIPESMLIDESYERTMKEFKKAIDLGIKGQCPSTYNCEKENLHRFLQLQ